MNQVNWGVGLGDSAPRSGSCTSKGPGGRQCDRCQSEGVCGAEGKCRQREADPVGPRRPRGGISSLSSEMPGCEPFRAGQHCQPSEAWGRQGVGGSDLQKDSEEQGSWSRELGGLGCVLEAELAGLRGRVGQDNQIPLSLFFPKMLTSAPPRLLLPS